MSLYEENGTGMVMPVAPMYGGMGNGGSGNSYGRRYYRDGRSYDRGYSGADDMMDMFNEMMNNASDSKEREVIQKMMNQYGM